MLVEILTVKVMFKHVIQLEHAYHINVFPLSSQIKKERHAFTLSDVFLVDTCILRNSLLLDSFLFGNTYIFLEGNLFRDIVNLF